MRFKVQILRTAYGRREIEIEAADKNEAEEKAINTAGDYEFTNHDADFEVEFVKQAE